MRWAATLRLRLRSLFRGARVEQELTEELQYHFDRLVDENLAAGMPRQDARYAAMREMGATEQNKEACRDERGVNLIDNFRRDVSFAFRSHAKSIGFTAVAVLSLAIGIGANTAIFSLWLGVLYAPLPGVKDPGDLVMLTDPGEAGGWTGRLDGSRPWVTFAEFEQLRRRSTAFTGVLASQSGLARFQARIEGAEPEATDGRLVSGNYFEVLGAGAVLGRVFDDDDDREQRAVAVISHAFWQRRFGGQPDVLGKTIVIRNAALSIIGVTAPAFIGETSGQRPDLWIPLRQQPQVMRGDQLHDSPPQKRMWLHAIARLKPGITVAQAQAEVTTIFQADLAAFYGDVAPDRRRVVMNQQLDVRPASGGASGARQEFKTSLNAMLAGVGVLLLIACANLANLLIAKGMARQAEIALRMSLGASRRRIIQQFATESLVLAAMGGAAAIVVAGVLHRGMVSLLARSDPSFAMSFALDPVVTAFLILATGAAALIFGVVPALQVTRVDASASLKEQSRGAVGALRQLRSSRALVSLQLALSLPLLVGAGLLAQTAINLERINYGYPTDHLAVARIDLRDVTSDLPRRVAVLRAVRAEILRVPGVQAVGYSQLGLFTGGESSSTIVVEGYVPKAGEEPESNVDVVSDGYFSSLKIPITLGREIGESDTASARVCVINEAFARRFFDGRHPLGLHIKPAAEDAAPPCEVIGVAKDARAQSLRDEVSPRFYLAAAQLPEEMDTPSYQVRTGRDTNAAIASIRKAIGRVDPSIGITVSRSFDEQVARLTAQDRSTAELAIVFGVVALVLAAIGLYGVLSYGIARRTGEIAVRIALGAQSARVIGMILGELTGVVAAGLALGAGLAYGLSRLIGSRLYGVAAQDPKTLAAALGILLTVALIAALIPARRAARLDPMAALRQQ